MNKWMHPADAHFFRLAVVVAQNEKALHTDETRAAPFQELSLPCGKASHYKERRFALGITYPLI